jgi:DNA-binding NtrC family response regulator
VPENTAQLAEVPLDLLNQAREGTLFLPEIGELTRAEQKGLRSIINRLDKTNTRLICATARPLPELVAQGTFDAQLYSVLATVTIGVPNLRERREDIPELANLLLLRSVEAKEVPSRHFSTGALNALRNHDWPGNLSQLESVVHTLAVTAAGEEISIAEVNNLLAHFSARPGPLGLSLDVPLREARDAFERVYFEHHIAKEGGNMSHVADSVGLERTHLYRKLKHLGIKLNRRGEE